MRWQISSARRCELLDKQDLIGEILGSFQAEIRPPPRDLPWEIRSMLAYIHEHLLSLDLNVAAVRKACRLANNNVSTRFRCAMGVGLRDYIEAGRMSAAKRLLRYEELEVYLIAMSVGYEHPETFCRAFRRHVGCTPSQWRSSSSSDGSSVDTDQALRQARQPAAESGEEVS